MTPAQQARAAVLEFVRSNPGAEPAGIRAHLGLSPQDCANAIKRLKGKLWRVGQPMLWRYFACPDLAQAARPAVEAELRQRRLDRAQRNNQSRAARRATQASQRPSGPTTKQRMREWVAQHEGCSYRDIAAGLQLGKGQMDKALYQLIQRGDVITVGPRGNMRYVVTRDGASRVDVNALLAERTQILAKRIAGVSPPRRVKSSLTSEDLAKRAQHKNELRQKRLQAQRAERDRLAAARLRDEQRAAVSGVAAKPKAPKPQQQERRIQPKPVQPPQVVVAKPAGQPLVTVKSSAEAWRQAEVIVPAGVKKIVCPPAPDRWASDVQRNRGVISQDWFARRQGQEVPSRLNGAYK